MDPSRTTAMLKQVTSDGDGAAAALLPLVYDELRRLAGSLMNAERSDHTLQPTALVHEAYLKLVDQRDTDWRNRAHFIAVAATAMRRLLCDCARARATAKRGGDWGRVTLSRQAAPGGLPTIDLLALSDALDALARKDERLARVVELRFFGGMSIEETSEHLGVSHGTVENDWAFARAWLARELGEGLGGGDQAGPA